MRNLLFVVSLISFQLFNAQTTPEERATSQTNRMKTELNLTDDQYSKVFDINLGIIMKNDGIKNSTFSEEVKKEVLQSNQQARKSMLKDVLTAAQYETLEKKTAKAIKKKRREKAEKKEVKN
ncbi:MAG: hypothetical protein FJZ80_10080 [Bacteroidetes bacterium]|nr:hypothetical protein [Bacteroidota bacterium]MBM3425282.1 hypothetical protein [Bacteroidota bacterium]